MPCKEEVAEGNGPQGEGVNKGVKVKVNSNEEVAEGNTAKREGVLIIRLTRHLNC